MDPIIFADVERVALTRLEALMLIDATRTPDALHGLLHIMDVTQAELASMVGLDRSRINHYDSGLSKVPAERAGQFRTVLSLYLDEYERGLKDLEAKGTGNPGYRVVDITVPIARAKIAACRKILKATA